MTARPRSVRLRAYDVGFGDCLLLTVTYGSVLPDGRRQRHMLIDCGTVEAAKGGLSLAGVAARVAEHCDGRLDVVVATHQQRDHVGGFGDPAARDVLRRLEPGVVVRPWTDRPEGGRADAPARQFLFLLDGVQRQAEALPRFAFDDARDARRAGLSATLVTKDAEAETLLAHWARRGRAEYVRGGDVVVLDEELPGVTVRVLGPASGDRLSAVARPGEHWLHLAADGRLAPLVGEPRAAALTEALHVLAEPGGAGAAEWLLRTLNDRRVAQGLEIAAAFDDLVHDTSVVLLVTVGSRTVLLPGDARTASWSQILDGDGRLARRLADVDIYKVGAHGARSGTPRRLADLWARRGAAAPPLVSVLSTKRGVVGAVPDDALVAGLAQLGPVHRTDDLPDGVAWMDVEAPASGRDPFAFSPGPGGN